MYVSGPCHGVYCVQSPWHTKVLFCRLTDYQRELYEDYLKGPEVEAMLYGRKWVS